MKQLSTNTRAALLLALSHPQDAVPVHQEMDIPLNATLASAWSPAKLARCRRLLAAGRRPPPIQVTRYLLHDEAWYLVGDGNHRTVAAQEAGHTHIAALVGAQVTCQPAAYRLDVAQRILWRRADADPATPWAFDLEADFIAALRMAGVATEPAPLDQ